MSVISPSAPTTNETRDQETSDLLARAATESHPAKVDRLLEEVVILNRGLALSLARRFEGRGLEAEDLKQVAMLGLVQAARRYRPDRGRGFIAFAAPTISGELKRYFRDHGWAVRPPRGLQEMHHHVRDASSALRQQLQREATDEEVATYLRTSVEEVRSARAVGERYRATSLDGPDREDSGPALSDTLADPGDDPYDKVVTLISLRAAMEDLDGRERQILSLRFSGDLTQRQIGERIGVSQMQVSRILTSVFRRLRARIEGRSTASVDGEGGSTTA